MNDLTTYRRQIPAAIERADMNDVIAKGIVAAKGRGRKQLIFSLFEAGLRYGLNLLLDHNDVIDVDWPTEHRFDDESLDYYTAGSDYVEKELSRVIHGLAESKDMDFILTTHDRVYYRDLKTCSDFEGVVDHE